MIKNIIARAGNFSKKSLFGVATAAGTVYAFKSNQYRYGHEYGTGSAAVMAGVSTLSFGAGIGITAVTIGYDQLNSLYNNQRLKRKSSFVKTNFQATKQSNDMRLLSIQSLSRAHGSRQRVIGNEAFYMFR